MLNYQRVPSGNLTMAQSKVRWFTHSKWWIFPSLFVCLPGRVPLWLRKSPSLCNFQAMPHDVSRVLPSLPPPASLQLDLGKTSSPATSENPWFPQGRHTPKKHVENHWKPMVSCLENLGYGRSLHVSDLLKGIGCLYPSWDLSVPHASCGIASRLKT